MAAADHTILEQASDWLKSGRKVAIATVVETWGSAPQPIGSQLVIDEEGNFIGSVSGGCVESDVYQNAQEVIASGEAKLVSYGFSDDQAWSVGLPCGGEIDIFIEPLEPEART